MGGGGQNQETGEFTRIDLATNRAFSNSKVLSVNTLVIMLAQNSTFPSREFYREYHGLHDFDFCR